MPLELAPIEPTTMDGVIVSATTERLVVMLPQWREDVFLRVTSQCDAWPRCNDAPAVNVTYRCLVDLEPMVPRILQMHPARQETDQPTTLLAPGGLLGPPDLLPITHPRALGDIVRRWFPKTKDKDREKILYLVRRAYGQGMRLAKR